MIYETVRAACVVVLKALYRLRVEGRENVPPAGGLVVASNHASFMDAMALASMSPRHLSWFARGTLAQSALYRFLTRPFHIISVRRGEGDREAMRVLRDALATGAACVVFPEGTRTADGSLGPLHRGFAVAARMAGVPVLPVWIEGTFDAWPKRRRLPRPYGDVRVVIGPPFDVAEGGERAAVERLEQALKDLERRAGRKGGASPAARC